MREGPVLIQGAEDSELCEVLAQLTERETSELGGYRFYRGRYRGLVLVANVTDIGLVNAACATTLGIQAFHPAVVINQGTAGAHVEDLHVGDIVVGESSVNINDLEMPPRGRGEGSFPLEWKFSGRSMVRQADREWLKLFANAPYVGGRKVLGRLGSGDVFNREMDRVLWIREQRGELCEDMESIGTFEVCGRLKVPCVGLRIISNNELTGEPYRAPIASDLQRFLLDALCPL